MFGKLGFDILVPSVGLADFWKVSFDILVLLSWLMFGKLVFNILVPLSWLIFAKLALMSSYR